MTWRAEPVRELTARDEGWRVMLEHSFFLSFFLYFALYIYIYDPGIDVFAL